VARAAALAATALPPLGGALGLLGMEILEGMATAPGARLWTAASARCRTPPISPSPLKNRLKVNAR
jgi:hypothetical protein